MADLENSSDEWELQHFDASWGGWRGLRRTWLDDEPARFHDQASAEALMSESLRESPSRRLRLYNLMTGEVLKPKGATRRG